MDLRQALFFSSKRIAVYDAPVPKEWGLKKYRLQVAIVEKEYKPFMQIGPGPFMADFFEITVSRMRVDSETHKETFDEPHLTYTATDLEKCIEYLQVWGVNVEDGWWIPEETWER